MLVFKSLQAQSKSDTTKYLLALYKYGYYSNRIIKDGTRLFAKDTTGKKLRGRMTILSETTFYLNNILKGQRDTFNLNELTKIRHTHVISSYYGVKFFLGGIISIVGGAFTFDEEIRNGLFLFGTAATGTGVVFMTGHTFNRKTHSYKIYTAKGFKLKPKHLPYLFTLNK
ncbi:MAG: hypothetical protein R2852_09480 [Bacteroidia bacterium]